MKIFLPLLLFLVCHLSSIANIDSLRNLYLASAEDTIKIRLLLETSKEFKNNSDSSFFYIFQAQKIINSGNFKDISTKVKLNANIVQQAAFVLFNNQQEKRAEKLFQLENKARTLLGDTLQIAKSLKNIAYVNRVMGNLDTAIFLYDSVAQIAVQIKEYKIAAQSIQGIAEIQESKQMIQEATETYQKTINYYFIAKDSAKAGMVYNLIGNMYKFRSEYETALEYYQKSLLIKEAIKDTIGISYAHIGIANVFMNWEYFDKAKEHYGICEQLSRKAGLNKGISAANIGLANVCQYEEDYSSALKYYSESLLIERMGNNPEGIALALLNMAEVYTKTNDPEKALGLYREALTLMYNTNNKIRINLILYMMGNCMLSKNDYSAAIEYFEKSLAVAREINFNQTILSDLEGLAHAYAGKKNFEKAYAYQQELFLLNDSLFNEEKMEQLTEMQEKFESEKKEKEILKKDLELKQNETEALFQKNVRNVLIAGVLLLLLLAVLIFRSYRQKKKANLIISEKNVLLEQANVEIKAQRDEIEAQRDIVTVQKNHIENIHEDQLSSIRYAKRIQEAMLPSLDFLQGEDIEHFIFFRPLDIVSGDFYWAAKQQNQLIIAVADCTGHGVPGAFMSMLGIAFLKEIVMKEYITQPDIILKKLRKEIIRSLKQNEDHNQKDGMDIALCSINLDTKELQFAGANNPLYIIRNAAFGHLPLATSLPAGRQLMANSELIEVKGDLSPGTSTLVEVKGDKMPIAIHERMDAFTLHTIQMEKGDSFYLFSDGFADQFGGPNNKKFKYKPLKEVLLNNSQLPLDEQNTIVEKTLSDWIGMNKQIDDITILGIKL
ncbi:MAG: hypothetical protein CVU05_14460 [Bacteroidetes bacterium HGW-Bacteroidetes-21]|jgi:serine phosphatase RsbU (regulator of sigma subunit)|nr:MAG: hypothetical protein CVU05_14460 [Bacteroidetes bacterium HGW-Bacteroidetes-21]